LRRARTVLFSGLLLAAALSAAEEAKPHGEAGAVREDFWKVANFVLLAGALGYVIYKKGGPFFAGRTEALRRNLEEAARMNRDAEARYAEVERRLAGLGAEIERLKMAAREESEAEGRRVREEIQQGLSRVREQTGLEIVAAAKAAQQELRVYAADLAVSLAERRIRDRVTPDSEGVRLHAMIEDLERRSDAGAMAS
jgi:F-type H+-transporting ATPase subunit b